MFKIEVNVEGTRHNYLSANAHDDDFLQFWIPNMTQQHGVAITKEDITAYKISQEDALKFNTLLADDLVDMETVGQVILKDSTGNPKHTIVATPLSRWSYDESGKFIGNE